MATTSSYVGGDKHSRSASTAPTGVERILETAGETAGTVAGAVEYGVDAVADEADSAMQTANDLTAAVRTSLKKNPVATLLVAAAVGFVIGAIWKD